MKHSTLFLTLLSLLTAAPINALAAGPTTKIPSDTVQFGKSGSTADKNLVFDFGLGASNPKVSSDSATNSLSFNKNKVNVGDGTSSIKNIAANIGAGSANPIIRYNPATTSWEFSTDGTNFSAFGTGSGGASIEMLANQGFESGVTLGWTNTGGTFAAVTSGANLLVGKGSASFTASASGQSFQSTLATIPNGLASGNCSAGLLYKGGDGTQSFEVITSGAVVLAGPLVLPAAAVATSKSLSFPCPSTGTSMQIKILSSSAGALYAYDQMHLGSNDLVQVSQAQWLGRVSYTGGGTNSTQVLTPNIVTNVGGTVATLGSVSAAPGSNIGVTLPSMGPGLYKFVMDGNFTCQQASSDTCYLGLSSSTSAYTNGQSVLLGNGGNANYSFPSTYVQAVPLTSSAGSTTFTLLAQLNSSASNSIFGDGTTTPITIDVYYYPSQAQTAVTPATSAQNWSGSTNGTTSLSSPTEADFPGTSTIAQRTNVNMGTVSASSVSEGVTWTPDKTGIVTVCARAGIALSSTSGNGVIVLTDASNNHLTEEQNVNSGSAGGQVPYNICADVSITSSGSPYTVKLRGSINTGSINAGTYPIAWSITPKTQQVPAPNLVKSVVQPSVGVENLVRVIFAGDAGGSTGCSSDPCTIVTQNGSAVTSVNRSGTGQYVINFAAGTFSQTPTCAGMGDTGGSNTACRSVFAGSSSTAFQVHGDSAGSAVDGVCSMICMGPK